MVKAVFIDIDNTLLDFNACATKAMKIAFTSHKLKFDKNTFPTFKSVNDGLWLRIERGEITREVLHDVRFNMIFERLGIKFDGHIIEREFLDNLNFCAIPVKGAKSIVKYLSKKYILCSASNAFYNQQINRLTASKLLPYLHKTFVSEKIGASKPSKEFFERSFSELDGIKPKDTVMIGDSVTADIEGGKNFGMQTIWFNRDKENIQSNADYVVTALKDIKKIL